MDAEQIQDSEGREGTDEREQNGPVVVDRIREILMGSQMRDYDTRLQHLNEYVVSASNEAHADLQKRIEASENLLREQLETLTNRLNAEHLERRLAIEKLACDLAEANRAFELKIQNLAEYACDIHELHRQVLEQSNALTAEVKQRQEQMLASLDHQGEQIRGAMVSREALAEILGDVALRMKNESHRPDA